MCSGWELLKTGREKVTAPLLFRPIGFQGRCQTVLSSFGFSIMCPDGKIENTRIQSPAPPPPRCTSTWKLTPVTRQKRFCERKSLSGEASKNLPSAGFTEKKGRRWLLFVTTDVADVPHPHQARQREGGEVEKCCLILKHFTRSVFVIKAAAAAAWWKINKWIHRLKKICRNISNRRLRLTPSCTSDPGERRLSLLTLQKLRTSEGNSKPLIKTLFILQRRKISRSKRSKWIINSRHPTGPRWSQAGVTGRMFESRNSRLFFILDYFPPPTVDTQRYARVRRGKKAHVLKVQTQS